MIVVANTIVRKHLPLGFLILELWPLRFAAFSILPILYAANTTGPLIAGMKIACVNQIENITD